MVFNLNLKALSIVFNAAILAYIFNRSIYLNNGIRTRRHCVNNLHVHLVFVAKYRRGVFTKEVLEFMMPIVKAACLDFEAEMVEFNGEDDHVHLLITYPPKVSPSKLVNSLKGVSSRMIRKESFPCITKKLWEEHLWSPSYFSGSCGAPLLTLSNNISISKEGNIRANAYITQL